MRADIRLKEKLTLRCEEVDVLHKGRPPPQDIVGSGGLADWLFTAGNIALMRLNLPKKAFLPRESCACKKMHNFFWQGSG